MTPLAHYWPGALLLATLTEPAFGARFGRPLSDLIGIGKKKATWRYWAAMGEQIPHAQYSHLELWERHLEKREVIQTTSRFGFPHCHSNFKKIHTRGNRKKLNISVAPLTGKLH